MTNAIRSGSAVIAAAALLLLSTGAEAVATYRSQLYWGAEPYGPYDQDVTTTTGGSYSLSGTGYSMTTSGSPLNNGTAEARFSSDIGAVSVFTQIQYTASIAGPVGVSVPVRVIAYGLAEGEGFDPCCGTEQYSAAAQFTMDTQQASLIAASAIVSTGFLTESFNVDQVIYIMSNTPLDIRLSAGAGTYSSYTHTSTITGHAFVDPQFIIDPAYASQFSFVGLPTAVPEPASGALLALGAGVMAFIRRARPAQRGSTQR